MKRITLAIFISLLIDAIISIIIATGAYLMGLPFLAAFLISFGTIFSIGNLWNVNQMSKDARSQNEIKAAESLIRSQQQIEISCAGCKSRNIVPIILTQDNYFKCVNCQVDNSILMDFTTAVRTTPVNPVMDVEDES